MDSVTLHTSVSQMSTPCFLVDIDRLKANVYRMHETCSRLKLDLRAHTKTHKTIEAADIITAGSRRKIATSTLAECEFYADNGYEDILFAYPITGDKMSRCVKLANQLQEFHVLLSSIEGLQCLREAATNLKGGRVWSVFLELDCGYGRGGFVWDSEDVVQAARCLWTESCFHLQGLYTHCGQSYRLKTCEQHKTLQENLVSQLLNVASRLRTEGIVVPVVGTGSTPTCSMSEDVLGALDEFHPGNFVFYDYQQVLIGSCSLDDVACCVATRIVSHQRNLNLLLVDCGFLGLSHDGMRQRPDDFCIIKDHEHLKLFEMTQEIGKITSRQGQIDFDRYPVGSMLFIYPYHSCATAAIHQHYVIHSGDKIIGIWKPVKGW